MAMGSNEIYQTMIDAQKRRTVGMTMMEKVADAMFDCNIQFKILTNKQLARAAIEAMREPTEEMLDAGAYDLDMTLKMQYQRMIDAALKE